VRSADGWRERPPTPQVCDGAGSHRPTSGALLWLRAQWHQLPPIAAIAPLAGCLLSCGPDSDY
jgi:hypothetical protein